MPPPPERPRPSRGWKGPGRWLRWIGLSAALILVAGWLALRSDAGRSYLAVKVSEFLSATLVGSIRIGKVRELAGGWAVLEDVEARDASGRVVVRVARLEASLDLAALLQGDVILDRAIATTAWVSLHRQGSSLAIAETFLPVGPTQPKPSSGPKPDPFLFEIRHAYVHGGTVVEIPGGLGAERVEAEGGLSYSDAFRLRVDSARGQLEHAHGGRLDLRSARGALRLGANEASQLQARLQLASDALQLEASARWGPEGIASAATQLSGELSQSGLTATGFAPSAPLLRHALALRASASWEALQQHWSLGCVLDTAGGQVTFDAERWPLHAEAHMRSPALALDQLLTIPGLTATAFDLSLQAERQGTTRQLVLRSTQLAYGSQHFPDWTARGSLDAQGAHLRELEIPGWKAQHGELHLDLEASYNGDAHGTLSARLPRIVPRSRLSGLSGGAQANALELSASAKYRAAADALEADAVARVASLRIAGISLRALRANLRARGALKHPELSLSAQATSIRVGSQQIDRAELSANGGPTHYRVTTRASAHKARAEAELTLALVGSEQHISGSGSITDWLPQPIKFQLDELRVRPDALEIGELRASAGSSLVSVEGRLGRTHGSDLHVRLEHLALQLPLRAASAQVPASALRGHLAAHLHCLGTLAAPELDLTAHVLDLTLDQKPVGTLSLQATLASRRRQLKGQLALNQPDGAFVQLALEGELAAAGAVLERLTRAHYALTARAKQDLRLLAQLTGEPATGALELSAQLAGRLQEPTGQVSIVGTGLALDQMGALDAELNVTLERAASTLELKLHDGRGALATLDARLDVGLLALSAAARQGRLEYVPGDYKLHVPERNLAELPPPLTRNEAIAVALDAQLTTATGASPRAHVLAQAHSSGPSAPAGCKGAAAPELKLNAQVEDGELTLNLAGGLGPLPVLRAVLTGPAPAFLRGAAAPARGGYALEASAQHFDLAHIPATCSMFAGEFDGTLHASELLTAHPRLEAQLALTGLRVRGTAPIDATVRAQGDDSGVHITTAEIRQGAVRALEASAHLPWVWDGKGKLVPDPDHCKVDARLTALQLAAPLSLVQTIAQPAGQATGAFTLRGCRDLAGLRGQLALEHTSFTLKDPLLRVDDLSARARVSANAIEIESLQLHDQSGELRGKGKLELKQGKPTRVALQLSSDEFPMRADATVIGFLDGRIGLSANWEALPRDVRVVLSDLSVRLPMRAAREPQELATHADVVYVNAKASAAASPDDDEPAAPVDLRIESEQPFWVRRDDFSVQLETHLRIQTEPSGVRITGTLLIQRGFINLLSKGFDIERGQLLFDGSAHPDPTVVIDAVHKLGDGQTVTVRIRERLSAPVITFSTSIAGVSTDAEIMQLLMRGRSATATETASAQVGAALAGMTSELIGSLGRTKFGKYVPVLSLEAGASSGTRIRAGVEANSLIPAKLRQYIEGAYVEGFVGGRNQGGDAQATGGVLMELYYPKRLVTGGKWELPNNWSVELTWEP